MIQFQEYTETGYALRTWENAKKADLTIAFAVDFDTAGEKLTRKAAYGKYYAVNMLYTFNQAITGCLEEINRRKPTILNIAGNGIYTLYKDGLVSQEQINEYVESFLLILCTATDKRFIIRSGGQTGVDEAALKAGDKLGLETICLAPKNWMFRDITGKDICDEQAFLARFGDEYLIGDLL